MKPVELLLPTEANETKHARCLKCYFFYSLFFQALHHCDGPHKTGISCTSEQPLTGWCPAALQCIHRAQITSLLFGYSFLYFYSIEVGNEFLITRGTFCGIGSWVYFLKQYYDTSYWVCLQGTKLILGYSSWDSWNLSLTHKLPDLMLRSGTCYPICKVM